MSRAHNASSTPEWRAWHGMRQRCLRRTHPNFALYGGRGITICERWASFAAFLSDMGARPSGAHSLDRIDNSKGYAPENCRWTTQREQMRNTRRTRFVVVNGERVSAASVYEQHGVSRSLFCTRVKRGWDPARAATTPPRPGGLLAESHTQSSVDSHAPTQGAAVTALRHGGAL